MESVGEFLRKEREAQGKSIADVAKVTKLSPRNLEALEEDRFSALPGLVYVKGHLKTYARFLGLSEDEVIGKYMRLTQQQETKELDEWDAVELELHEQKKRSNRTWIVIVVGIVAVVAAVWLVSKWRAPSSNEDVPIVNNELRARTGADTMIEWHRLELLVAAKERTWVKVSVDGTVVSDLTLEAGEKRKWEGDERFSLDVGNGGALDLYLDDKYLGTAGKGPRLVEGLVITEQGLPREKKTSE
jgi:transcriptional regulator with XRE-family HTH domain